LLFTESAPLSTAEWIANNRRRKEC